MLMPTIFFTINQFYGHNLRHTEHIKQINNIKNKITLQ